MEDKFIFNLETFSTEMQNESLHNFHVENTEYEDLYTSYAQGSDEWNRIVDSLPEKEKDFFINYKEKENQLTGMEFDRLYQQGYKDCMKMLKYMGAF